MVRPTLAKTVCGGCSPFSPSSDPSGAASQAGTTLRKTSAFTLLELVVVLVIVGLLIALAAGRLLELREEAESAALEQVLGGLRAGVAMKLMSLVAAGRDQEIDGLPHTNPMTYLMQVPSNYLGELDEPDPARIPPGHWYFDRRSAVLVYRVRFARHFTTPLSGPPRARFQVRLLYQDRNASGRFEAGSDPLQGVRVEPLEPYGWRFESRRIPDSDRRPAETRQGQRGWAAASFG